MYMENTSLDKNDLEICVTLYKIIIVCPNNRYNVIECAYERRPQSLTL